MDVSVVRVKLGEIKDMATTDDQWWTYQAAS